VTAVGVAPSRPFRARPAKLRSAIYEGTLTHRRFGPGVPHSFAYEVAMPLLYLDELDAVTRLHPLWSARKPAPIWFRRADFLGDRNRSLGEAARDLAEQTLGYRPGGEVALLANLRTWGFLFNPISMYFCTSSAGGPAALVAEVESTPWHERHAYVVGPPGHYRFGKVMHVSPFLPMDVDYELVYTAPGERFAARLDVVRGHERLLKVTLSLRRRAIDRRALAQLLWHHPFMTHRVTTGIYAQAARLGMRGAPFHQHPARRVGRP